MGTSNLDWMNEATFKNDSGNFVGFKHYLPLLHNQNIMALLGMLIVHALPLASVYQFGPLNKLNMATKCGEEFTGGKKIYIICV